MQTTQTTDHAATAAASDEHVRRLQSQLQTTAEQRAVVEQVVGASGGLAVEPGQPGQPQEQPPAKRLKTAAAAAATTAQPGVPRYVVPPATGDLAYGRSHWDGKPAEIHAMILKHAGPLTRFLCGLLGDTDTLDEATKLQLWTDALKMDWQGDLALLPDANLTADNGLLLAHSRSMYDRLCKRFPDYTEPSYARSDAYNNNHVNTFFSVSHWHSSRLMLIPMRHGWFDLVDFTYPITLAQMAIRFGCLDLLKHLDDKYKILQDWMAKHVPTSTYWHEAVDEAARYGHLDVLQYLFDLGVTRCTTKAMDCAAANGHLPVVIWLHDNRTVRCTTYAMDGAGSNGHLHVVKWLHENTAAGCTTDAMDLAAKYGHYDVLKWLHANRTEGCTTKAMRDAAYGGHLHVVKWLHEIRGEPCTSGALDDAIYQGHMDIVKYMHSKGIRASNDAIDSSSKNGDAKMLQYLLDYGYEFELDALDNAKTAAIANILLGSLTLDRAQTLLARAKQGEGNKTTIKRIESTIKKLQKPRK